MPRLTCVVFASPILKGSGLSWHCPIMKCFMCGLLIFSAFARADERTDRVEIQGIIDALNN